MTPVFRFAPSPNGELHLGHALSALLNYEASKSLNGRFLLRIEDIDPERCRPEYESGIFRDLEWLGIEWETPVRRQSEHMDAYISATRWLSQQGLAYPAFMSRADIALAVQRPDWPRDPDGAPFYPPDDRQLSPTEAAARIRDGVPHTLRLDTSRALAKTGSLFWREDGEGPDGETGLVAARPQDWGDFIIARRDVPTAYHLAVVVDDALQQVTHVVRGNDPFHATSAHRLLQSLLDYPAPAYRHHRLILDESGRKLSKSNQATALRAMRESGITPAGIRQMAGLQEA